MRSRRRVQSKQVRAKTCYGPRDCDGGRKAEVPGEFPFTRGVYPEMYRSRLWTMRQYAGFGSAEESNHRFRYLLSQGTTGLSVAFDLPTQIGLDSDHPLACGEVGRVGVAIDSIHDMERLLAEIPLAKVSTSMTINATAAVLLALYLVVARRQDVDWHRLEGTVQNDILKEYVARGTYIYPAAGSMRIVTDIFEFCAAEVPRWNTISVSGYHIREAGSTAAQEIAFTLANAEAYVTAALARGLELEQFARRISFFFNAHNNLLEEVAKFRAARRLWARLMRDRFGSDDPRCQQLRFHTQTAGSTLTAQQPDANIVRVAVQALAAILGGTQSLHTNSLDEAMALPTAESARLALRTQQLLSAETGVADVVDPLGGSYCIEALTEGLESEAEEYLEKIRALGGAEKAIEAGFVQREIQEAAFEHQRRLESGEQLQVGVNCYQQEKSRAIETMRVDPDVEGRQTERLREMKRRRSKAGVGLALETLESAAAAGTNLMPPIIEAVEAEVTVGEISDALRKVFGEYRERVVI